AEIVAMGYSATTAGREALNAPTEWFSNVENAHDFVLYAAEADETAWKHLVGRQVDRLFLVGRGDQALGAERLRGQALLRRRRLV
ncbi:hypothetical protein VQE80_15395, partial [Staphylococcus shinii]|uniref:hypothetical protein n=1 Tax=Staphylococcus shinii TaxID=2912228 RepID=UPI003F47919A